MKRHRFRKMFQVKWLIIAVGILILLTVLWVAAMEWITHTLAARQVEIRRALNEQLGSTVQFDSLQTGWSGFSVRVTLNEVKALDQKTKVVFLTAKHLRMCSTLLQFLFKSDQPFQEIILDGLKMRLKWTDQHDILPLGLKGEPLSSDSSDTQKVLQGLAAQERITLKHGEIVWQGPHTQLLQKVDGTLFWNDVSSLSWQFIGKQQLKLNDAKEFLPIAKLDLKKDSAINQFKFQMEWAGIDVTALMTMDKTPKLDCRIAVDNVDVASFHQNLLLKSQDPEWIRWLLRALEKGTLTSGEIKLQGPIDQLDWQGEVGFKQLDIQYAEDWPKINQAKGQVLFSKEKVLVKLSRGHLSGGVLDSSEVLVAPLGEKEKTIVTVDGAVEGTLENGMSFLQDSPLKESVGKQLAALNPKGPMELKLKLTIPLSEKPTQVQGNLRVKNAKLIIDQLKESPVSDFSGVFEFTEEGVTGQNVKGKWLEQAVAFEVKPDHIQTRVRISVDYLQSQLKTEAFSYITGGSEMDLRYQMDKGEWIIESNLKGIAIDLPPPLTKTSDTETKMRFTFYPVTKQAEQRYSLNLKGELDAKWVMETQDKGLSFKRGHLVLGGGKADWITNNVLIVNGELPHLDIDVWRAFLGKLETTPQHLPIQLHLLAADIEAFGLNFKNTWINLNHEKNQSQWILDGPTIKGSIMLPSEQQKTMQLHFDHLKLNLQEIKNQKDSEFFKGEERFPIEFSSKHIELGGTVYGQAEFYLEPKPFGYNIKNLSVRTNDSILEATGLWRLDNPKDGELSFLQGTLSTENISNTFSQWGFSTSMREGQGRIYFNLHWPGSPFQLSLKSAQGGARLKIRRGRILGVDPGLGKILGLLSLESLARRLQLDFRDVVQKGFAFDTLNAEIVFKDGHANTQDLKIGSPVANIQMNGGANLLTRTLDLQMIVMPKVGNMLPLVAGIAYPPAGIGVWVIDKLTGSRILQAPKRYYRVTGTWDAPSIQEMRK